MSTIGFHLAVVERRLRSQWLVIGGLLAAPVVLVLGGCSQSTYVAPDQLRPPTVQKPSDVAVVTPAAAERCNNLGVISKSWLVSMPGALDDAKSDVYRLGGNGMALVTVQEPNLPSNSGEDLSIFFSRQGSVTVVALWCPPEVLSPAAAQRSAQKDALRLRFQLELPRALEILRVSRNAYDAQIAKLTAINLNPENESALETFLLRESDNAAVLIYRLSEAPMSYLTRIAGYTPDALTSELRHQQSRVRAGLAVSE
jgi:hypothetical protein